MLDNEVTLISAIWVATILKSWRGNIHDKTALATATTNDSQALETLGAARATVLRAREADESRHMI